VRRPPAGLPVGLLVLSLLAGCSTWHPFGGRGQGARPDVSRGVEIVQTPSVVSFYEQASSFYGRLARRRFNTLDTYQDKQLRRFFRTEEAYADYYANLAHALGEAHFRRDKPLSVDVLGFDLEAPGRARVTTELVGKNGLPLRFWNVRLRREDQWERIDGSWWIVPGKL
jgi:hypothetical protein